LLSAGPKVLRGRRYNHADAHFSEHSSYHTNGPDNANDTNSAADAADADDPDDPDDASRPDNPEWRI
jgi:hypothetical protein